MDRREVLGLLAGAGISLNLSYPLRLLDSKPDQKSQKTFRNHKGFVDTQQGQIYYWTAGKGPNLVLIHQSSNSSDEYLDLIPLHADQYKLIAVDLPGHGRSDDPTSEPTVEDYAQAVIDVMDHLDINSTHVLGHHGGALQTIYLKATFPKRFDKAILSGTGGIPTLKSRQDFIDLLINSEKTVTKNSSYILKLWDRYMEMLSEGADPKSMLRPIIAYLDARFRPYRGILVNLKWDRTEFVHRLSGPVLLVQGGKDQYVSNQESLLEIIPDSTRVEMPGCGAFVFYDRPDLCAQMIKNYLG